MLYWEAESCGGGEAYEEEEGGGITWLFRSDVSILNGGLSPGLKVFFSLVSLKLLNKEEYKLFYSSFLRLRPDSL